MLYLVYKIGLLIVRCCSTGSAYAIVSLFAKIRYFISQRDRRIVRSNLRHVFPGMDKKEISSYAKGVFVNFSRYLVDFFSLGSGQRQDAREVIEAEGLKNLDEALKPGKGCIIVTGHFGNWELGGCALASLGYKLNVVALEHADPRINDLFINQRRQCGVQVMHTGSAKAVCQAALRRGEIIAILADRPFGDRGVEISFFGKPAIFPRGAAIFSLKYGSPIVMSFIYKADERKKKNTIVLEKPFLIKRQGDLEGQLKEITQRFSARFEHYIRKYPSQWYMFNKVWKD